MAGPSEISNAIRGQGFAIGREGQSAYPAGMPAQGRQVTGMAEPPEVVPFKTAQVLLVELGPETFEQLQNASRLTGFPGLHCQVRLSGEEPPAGESLLRHGGLLVRD